MNSASEHPQEAGKVWFLTFFSLQQLGWMTLTLSGSFLCRTRAMRKGPRRVYDFSKYPKLLYFKIHLIGVNDLISIKQYGFSIAHSPHQPTCCYLTQEINAHSTGERPWRESLSKASFIESPLCSSPGLWSNQRRNSFQKLHPRF